MANPQINAFGSGTAGTTSDVTVSMPSSWSAGMIIVLFVASDGFDVVLSQANGFVLAADPQGNEAKAIITGVVGFHVFWKRAIGGSGGGLDPAPVVAAPTSNGGTVIAAHTNAYSGCRSSGTPFHKVQTALITSAANAANPPAITTTLSGCTMLAVAAVEYNEPTYHGWGGTGAADPSPTLNIGTNTGLGNACSFSGGIGGRATPGTVSLSYVFDSSSRQAQASLILASQAEASVVGSIDGQLEGSSGTSTMAAVVGGSVSGQLEGSSGDASSTAVVGASVDGILGGSTGASTATVTIVASATGALEGSSGTTSAIVPASGGVDGRLEGSSSAASASALASGVVDALLEGSSPATLAAVLVSATASGELGGSQGSSSALAGPGSFALVDGLLEGSTSQAQGTVTSLVPPRHPRGTKGAVRRRL